MTDSAIADLRAAIELFVSLDTALGSNGVLEFAVTLLKGFRGDASTSRENVMTQLTREVQIHLDQSSGNTCCLYPADNNANRRRLLRFPSTFSASAPQL